MPSRRSHSGFSALGGRLPVARKAVRRRKIARGCGAVARGEKKASPIFSGTFSSSRELNRLGYRLRKRLTNVPC